MKLLLAALTALVHTCVGAQANEFPDRPIRIIAPASAGSGTDMAARAIGQQMSLFLKQPVIVENRVGGGGSIGVDHVVRAAPDGHTLLLSTDATAAIQPHVMQLGYDTLADLAPIGEVGRFPLVVMAGNGTGIASIADLARVARERPQGISFGMGGRGTGGHIVGETVRLALGVPMTAVAYPSAARAIGDMVGGHVEVAFGDTSAVAQVKAGALKAIAMASAERAVCLPDVPTLSEQGVPFDLPYSYGLLAPARTPPATVARLNAALVHALHTREVREWQARECLTAPPAANQPGDFATRLRYHHRRWGELIRSAGIRI